MSELSNKYKEIMEDIQKNIKDEKILQYVKEKMSELSLLYMDIIDRVTNISEERINSIEESQKDLSIRLNSIKKILDEIESDIYDDEKFDFEIVCPYCNHEFTTDIDPEENGEIECPKCNNIIELDWNSEEDEGGCLGNCHNCSGSCLEDDDENNEDEKDDM